MLHNHPSHHPLQVGMEFPFTIAQWQELQRQAMIYKYMMASVPVPSQLLIPISPTTTTTSSSSSSYAVRFRGNALDAEAWRCRRTDGKKWRCSRDVAPHHKYCDKHINKNRSRSRKLVEPKPSHKDATFTPIPSYNKQPRISGEALPTRGALLQKQIQSQTTLGLSNESLLFQGEPLKYNSYDEQRKDFNMFLNMESSKDFADAWSNGNQYLNSTAKTSTGYSLDLSMGGSNSIVDEMGLAKDNTMSCMQEQSWLAPASWVPSSTPGGPLAEVLRPITGANSRPESPLSTSRSPSLVASLSDSSSKTFGSLKPPSMEMPLLWLSGDKLT